MAAASPAPGAAGAGFAVSGNINSTLNGMDNGSEPNATATMDTAPADSEAAPADDETAPAEGELAPREGEPALDGSPEDSVTKLQAQLNALRNSVASAPARGDAATTGVRSLQQVEEAAAEARRRAEEELRILRQELAALRGSPAAAAEQAAASAAEDAASEEVVASAAARVDADLAAARRAADSAAEEHTRHQAQLGLARRASAAAARIRAELAAARREAAAMHVTASPSSGTPAPWDAPPEPDDPEQPVESGQATHFAGRQPLQQQAHQGQYRQQQPDQGRPFQQGGAYPAHHQQQQQQRKPFLPRRHDDSGDNNDRGQRPRT